MLVISKPDVMAPSPPPPPQTSRPSRTPPSNSSSQTLPTNPPPPSGQRLVGGIVRVRAWLAPPPPPRSGESRQEVGDQPRHLAQPTTPATSCCLVQHPPFPAPQPTSPTAPPNTHHGVEPPAATQQRSTPATTHTCARHAWLRGRRWRSKGMRERLGGSCCARQRKDWARDLGGERLLCAPVKETTQQVDIPGPTSRRWGEVPHRRLGMAAWTYLANGEGTFAFLCADSTRRRETGQVRGLCWHNRPREWKGKEW